MGNPTMWFEVAGKDHAYSTIDTGGRGIPGGIGRTPDGKTHVTFYVEVEDLEASLGKAEELGGSRVMGPTDIPTGQIAMFADPEGVGLMTPTG